MWILTNIFTPQPPRPTVDPYDSDSVKLMTLCSFFRKKEIQDTESCEDGEASITKRVPRKFQVRVETLKGLKRRAITPEKKDQHACMLYQVVLMKIVTLIKKKQYILKNTEVDEKTRIEAEKFIHIFNKYFQKYLNKYKQTPIRMTFKTLLINEVYSFIPLVKTPRFLLPEEIEAKKQFADKGYAMIKELEKWLATPVLNPNQHFSQVLQLEFNQFLKWAEKYPRSASFLAADIALTCSLLLEQSVFDCFMTTLNAKICASHFLDALGLCPEYEEVEEDEMLKFRALADFVSYFPIVAGSYKIIKNSMAGQYKSFFEGAVDAIKITTTVKVLQKGCRIIPQEQDKLVSLAMKILRGEEMQKIVLHQRNLSLIQTSFSLKQILKNPTQVFAKLELWWQILLDAEGEEKKERIVAQLLLPAAVIALFATTLWFCSLVGFSLNFSTVYGMGTTLMSAIIGISSFLTYQIDKKYGFTTKARAISSIEERRREEQLVQAYSLLTKDPEKIKEIAEEAKKFVQDLQKQLALPVIPESIREKRLTLLEEPKQLIENLRQDYEEKLAGSYHAEQNPLKAIDVVSIFNQTVNLKNLKIDLKLRPKEEIDVITFSVAEDLIKGWLQKHLEETFRKKCINHLCKTKKETANKRKTFNSPQEYLAQTELNQHREFLSTLIKV